MNWHVCEPKGEPTRDVWPYPAFLCSNCRATGEHSIDFDPAEGLPPGFQMVRMRVAPVPQVPPLQVECPPQAPRLERVHPNYPTYPGWVRLYPCPPERHYFSQPPVIPQPDGDLRAAVRGGQVEFSVDAGDGVS